MPKPVTPGRRKTKKSTKPKKTASDKKVDVAAVGGSRRRYQRV